MPQDTNTFRISPPVLLRFVSAIGLTSSSEENEIVLPKPERNSNQAPFGSGSNTCWESHLPNDLLAQVSLEH